MAGADELLAVIEALYAAGLDTERWPRALEAVTRIVGGTATTLELFERPSLRHREFHAFGAPLGCIQ
jgi:hypothetical protein